MHSWSSQDGEKNQLNNNFRARFFYKTFCTNLFISITLYWQVFFLADSHNDPQSTGYPRKLTQGGVTFHEISVLAAETPNKSFCASIEIYIYIQVSYATRTPYTYVASLAVNQHAYVIKCLLKHHDRICIVYSQQSVSWAISHKRTMFV